MKRALSKLWPSLLALVLFAAPAQAFYNPIVTHGQDPSVFYVNGYYYLAQTTAGGIAVTRSRTLTGLASGTRVQVWTAPASGAYCCEIWAPEIQYINGRFYIYFAADDGNNANHRMYVLESNSGDGIGSYTFRGKIAPPTDRWAIDGAVLQRGSQLYFVWSGWEGTVNDQQHLYIAPMSNPYTISGERVRLSSPDRPWERVVGNPYINEGPQPLVRNGKMFIVYSANGSWSDQYCLGMLTANESANPLNPASWTKSNGCVFSQRDTAHGPGHNSFTKSPDGTEDWLVYHANLAPGTGWGGRSIRIQKFTWDAAGNPVFGMPVSRNDDIAQPSGEEPLPAPARLEASNFSGSFVRHAFGRGRIDANVAPLQDSQWRMVPGLSNPAGVSFQSVNFPGNYLRHRNGEVWNDAYDGSALFRADATWFRRPGLANGIQVYFESSNFPGNYLRHRNGLLYNEAVPDALGRSDATFVQHGGGTVGVIFYQDINYGGAASPAFGKGDYPVLPAGVPNDWMSSLRAPSGWIVEAYEHGGFGGAVCTFTADTPWVGAGCNDKMSSFRIR